MYNEFAIPVLLCVGGLILMADFLPFELEWSPDQNPDPEDDLIVNEDNQQASQANNGAATQSMT